MIDDERRFDFDVEKSEANRKKHWIDFKAAQALWRDRQRIIRETVYLNEPRFLVTGLINDKLWTAVVTYRGEAVRLISVRLARIIEAKGYGTEDYHAEKFDALFDADSDDIDSYVDWDRRVRPSPEQDIDFELDIADSLVERIEVVARKTGTTRAELIRRWLTEKLDEAA